MTEFGNHKGKIPMKAPGCRLEFWTGVIGLTTNLCVWDGGHPSAYASQMSERSRVALANYMIALWTRFRDHPEQGKEDLRRLSKAVKKARRELAA